MDWVLDHLQVLIFVAIAVTAVMQRMKRAAGGAESRPTAPMDQEEEARTRQIQEEMRRRRLERGGLPPSDAPARETASEPPPFPAAPPLIEEVRPVRLEPPREAAAEARESARVIAELKRQQELAERVRELDAARRTQATIAAESARTALASAADRPLPELRSHAGLRRAILLREVLGPPVGLR